MKKNTIFFIVLFCIVIAKAQVNMDSVQIERVAKTCELWGHLMYFHPYLIDNSLDWESAFTKNIEWVLNANNRKEYGKAIKNLLDELNDPVTTVLPNKKVSRSEDTLKYPIIEFIQDSILRVSINDYGDLEDIRYVLDQFSSFTDKMPQSRGVIFDIRSPENLGELKGYLSWYFESIAGNFSDKDIQLPGLRARFHDGFEPETGGLSGGYYSGYYIKSQKKVSPNQGAVQKPIVFIVNEYAEIPMIAFGLQMADKAQIISTQALTDASIVETVNFQMDDSLVVSLRLNELPPGTFLNADYVIPANTGDTQIIQMATQLIRGQEITNVSVPYRKEESVSALAIDQGKYTNTYPDIGHRLLAAAKMWTVIHYFFAYQDLMDKDWNEVLRDFIPRFVNATDSLEYNLVVAEMYQNIQDGHGYIRSKILNKYFGQAAPPVKIRYIEEQPVIIDLLPDSVYKIRGLKIGDIILEIDGEKAMDRFDRYSKYISTSNQAWLKNTIANRLLDGKDSTEVLIKIQKKDQSIKSVSIPRSISFKQQIKQLGNGRNDQPIIRLVNEDIGYADLDRLTIDMVDKMFVDFKDTKAIIFDMRGYPNGTAWSIAPYLNNKDKVYAANFRRYSPMGINMGSSKNMTFFDQQIPPPTFPTYLGKTIMLIDERTISQAEHTGLFFEEANGTVFIGSQTAGANGDVTNFQIPGKITLNFSGHDVRHIDGRQLQKIGLEPALEVKPTIKGIRIGEDEVLERGIEYLIGVIEE